MLSTAMCCMSANAFAGTLYDCARDGYAECVAEKLAEEDTYVNETYYDGETALMKAAEGGHKEIVAMLLANGADVNAKDNNGRTALMKAVEIGCKSEVIRALIKSGADVKVKDKNRKSILYYMDRNSSLKDTEVYQELKNMM